MFPTTDDLRIKSLRPLPPPAILMEELPMSDEHERLVATARSGVGEIIDGKDDRLLVVMGPCSIHDTSAALDYAARLKAQADQYQAELLIVMRTYFEKPRTTVG